MMRKDLEKKNTSRGEDDKEKGREKKEMGKKEMGGGVPSRGGKCRRRPH